MAVLAIRDEVKCKVCQSEHRGEIDALLEMRSKHKRDDSGNRVNKEYVFEAMRQFGVENPTVENIQNHWKKHCQVVEGTQAGSAAVSPERAELEALILENLGEDWRSRVIRVPAFLPVILTYLSFEMIERMREGKPLGSLVEQYQKLAAEAGRRKSDEAVTDLNEALALAAGATVDEEEEELVYT